MSITPVMPAFRGSIADVPFAERTETPLPCPFCGRADCGGIVDSSILTGDDDGDAEPTFWVECSECGAEGPAA